MIHSFKEDVDYEGDIPESSFNSNFAYNCGGAIYNEEYATLDYFSFYDNAADKDGGAVYNSESGDISVYESKFYGNAAVNGGSIFNMNCSSVYDSSFSNNRADKSGGAIYNYYDDNTFAVCDVQASKFENNVANRGGAIYNAIVNDCRFTNNTAHKYGSNIYKGVIIGSYGDESKLYKTIKSTGLSINAKKCKAKLSNGNLTNMTLNVIVTSNPNGELISGALVCLELDVQDDFDDFGDFYDLGESGYYLYAVSNKKGVASFKLPDLNFKEYHFATIFVDGYWGNATIESDLGRLVYVGNSKVRFSNDIVFTYGATGSTNLTLTGASGVKASVANHSEAVVNVDKKSISVSGLEPGKYVLNVETIPKDYYNPVNATLNITVRKIPKVDFTAGIVFDYGSSGTVHMIVDGGLLKVRILRL